MTKAVGRGEAGAGAGAQTAGTERAALGSSAGSASKIAAQSSILSGALRENAGAVVLTQQMRLAAAHETAGTGASHYLRRSADMQKGPEKVLITTSGISTSGQSTGTGLWASAARRLHSLT